MDPSRPNLGTLTSGERLLARMQVPLVIMALLTPATIACSVAGTDPVRRLGQAGYWAIWGAFVVEFVLAMAVLPDRRRWLRDNAFSTALLVAASPWAPPVMQIFRTLTVARVWRWRRRFALDPGRLREDLFSGLGLRLAAAAALVLVVAAGWAFSAVEDVPLGDGVWWAMATVTTVGYGDVVPDSTGGRLIGVCLMLVGVALFGLLLGTATERLLPRTRAGNAADAEASGKLDEVLRRLDRLEELERRIARLERPEPPDGGRGA